MRLPWFLLLARLTWSARVPGQDSAQDRILALENAWNEAVQQGDGNAVEPLLGNELIYIDYDGKVMDKARYRASVMATPLHAEQVVNESMRVQVYGQTAVVVGVYRERGTKNGKAYLHRERFVDMWVNRAVFGSALQPVHAHYALSV